MKYVSIRTMPPSNTYYQPPVVPQQPMPGMPIEPPTPPRKPKQPVILIVAFVIALLLLASAGAFAFWAYAQMQDYKNNSDKKSATAVEIANKKQKEELEKEFAELEKTPNKTYTSPAQDGSISFAYPKTWSSYIIEADGNIPLDGFFQPNFVPNVAGDQNAYALRMQLLAQDYNSVLSQYQNNIKKGTLKSTPYVDQNVKGAATGVRLDGQLSSTKQGSMIIIPIRDKVFKLWTENNTTINDFNNTVLKTLTYSP